jgi:hypothetical protein
MSQGSEAPDGLPIIQYWHSGDVPADVTERIETFNRQNRELRHLVFDRAGADRFIADHYGDRELSAFRACAVPSMQADYFRYCSVLAMGGVYADVSYRCLQPLWKIGPGGQLFSVIPRRSPVPGKLVINGLFAFGVHGHPLLKLTLEIVTANIEGRIAEKVQLVTGPWIFSALAILKQLGADDSLRREALVHGMDRMADVFCREFSAVIPTPEGRRAVPTLIPCMFDAIGSYERICTAFEGVSIASITEVSAYIEAPARSLSYKQSDDYWISWQGQGRSIFR